MPFKKSLYSKSIKYPSCINKEGDETKSLSSVILLFQARYDSASGHVQHVVYSERQGKQACTLEVVHEASLEVQVQFSL